MKRGLGCTWLLVGLALGSHAAGSTSDLAESVPGKVGTAEPEFERALARLTKAPSMLSLQAALQRLQQAYPERILLESYGKSRQGRELHRVRLLPWDRELGRARTGQPAVCLVPDLQGKPSALTLLRGISEHLENEQASQILEWIVYPLPDPDGWVGGSVASAGVDGVRLDRNFPEGWLPWLEGPGHPGSAPLSEPEVRSLSRSLAGCQEAVALVLLHGSSGVPSGPARAGSLRRHAVVGLGLSVHGLVDGDPWSPVFQAIETTRPVLDARVLSMKRLSQDLHLVDIQVGNRGKGHASLSQVAMGWTGAHCLKRAWSPGSEEPHVEWNSNTLPPLVAGAKPIHVRLVLRVSDPDALVLHLDAPKTQAITLSIESGESGVGG
ncbi:MAG: M14 family zinc carboxypeptidase [Planctomycetota bacterium]|nr:M14 family zinc carboxypeptidase [Planctomycetota bacterium]